MTGSFRQLHLPAVTAVVLCGGRGQRLGAGNKPLVEVAGTTLIARVIDRLAPQVGDIIVSANDDVDAYRALGFPVIEDRVCDLGPLGGLDAAARDIPNEWLFVCPGDAPLIPRDLVARLYCALARDPGEIAFPDIALPRLAVPQIAVPHDGKRVQHLFMLLRRTLASSIAPYLESGRRSVIGWIEGHSPVVVDCGDVGSQFINVNTPADLARLERELR